MQRAALLIRPGPGWAAPLVGELHPGAYVAVLINDAHACLEARRVGLCVRDTLMVFLPGLQTASVLLLRMPLEHAVIEQAVTTGSGALHIDSARVYTDWKEADRPASWKASGHSAKPDATKIAAPPGVGISLHPAGRWPTNVVLVHGPGCHRIGTKRVRGTNLPGPERRSALGAMNDDGWQPKVQPLTTHTEPDGMETVASWECGVGCPVIVLDAMSGILKTNAGSITTTMASMSFHGGSGSARKVKSDNGGASRFYPQFESEAEMIRWIARLLGGELYQSPSGGGGRRRAGLALGAGCGKRASHAV